MKIISLKTTRPRANETMLLWEVNKTCKHCRNSLLGWNGVGQLFFVGWGVTPVPKNELSIFAYLSSMRHNGILNRGFKTWFSRTKSNPVIDRSVLVKIGAIALNPNSVEPAYHNFWSVGVRKLKFGMRHVFKSILRILWYFFWNFTVLPLKRGFPLKA